MELEKYVVVADLARNPDVAGVVEAGKQRSMISLDGLVGQDGLNGFETTDTSGEGTLLLAQFLLSDAGAFLRQALVTEVVEVLSTAAVSCCLLLAKSWRRLDTTQLGFC